MNMGVVEGELKMSFCIRRPPSIMGGFMALDGGLRILSRLPILHSRKWLRESKAMESFFLYTHIYVKFDLIIISHTSSHGAPRSSPTWYPL